MGMLRRMVERRCSLVDYERVVDERNRRLIFFSWFAGTAGAIDTLHAAGLRYRWLGLETPLLDVRPTHAYSDLASAREALHRVGERIRDEGFPAALSPFVVGITGYGNVSQGAQDILEWLPVEEVRPEELPALRARADAPRDRVFQVVFHEEHTVEPRAPGARFHLEEYFQHPDRYRGVFERHVVHLDVLVNAVFWTPVHPRLLTLDFLRAWYGGAERPRLQVVGDVSCDIGGSVECCLKTSSPDEPCFVYDPVTAGVADGCEGPGVVMMTVDNLPCELPREASEMFSGVLGQYVASIVKADFSDPFERLALPDPIRRALVLHRGEFTPEYRYMAGFL
jgi:alpha-aminoadipic semialdehyde synthase